MNIEHLCEGIRLHPEAMQEVREYRLEEFEYEEARQQFYNDYASFFEQIKQTPRYRKRLLFLFIRFAVDLYEEYKLRGIDDSVYYDTFSDIQIWCMECQRQFGEYGIEEYGWLKEHVRLQLFRLGRLQFQPYPMKCDVIVDGKKISKNQIVLNVHIPAGEPLDNNKVEESFALARRFFRGVAPVFICHTWMLEPKLAHILKPESNIMQFQSHFYIYQLDPESRQAEERIFQTVSSNYSEYPETTGLQRSAKHYLLAGHRLGSAYGIKV